LLAEYEFECEKAGNKKGSPEELEGLPLVAKFEEDYSPESETR
jgi:hypothetical protein